MHQHEIDAVVGALAPVIKDYVTGQIAKAVSPLQSRLDAVERRPDLKYIGVWNERASYRYGNLVTFDGGIWHANTSSQGVKPSTASAIWTLAVKAGAR